MRRAVVPGSFDPVTVGHLDIIRRACSLFDEVLVTAMINPEKQYTFTVEERLAFLRDAVQELPNVRVDFSDGMLYEYVNRHHACAIVKGIRNGKDAEYELWMADFNSAHAPECETILLPAKKELEEISSTEIKRRWKSGEPFECYVPSAVAEAMNQKTN